MSTPEPEIVVADDTTALIAQAGQRLVYVIVSAQRDRGAASIVLTGGSNGIAILEWLRAHSEDVDWRAVDVYFGDDRFVPRDDDERNHGQAARALLDHVDLDPARVFVMEPSDGRFGDDIDAAAADYARILREHADGADSPVFDVHLLGMGGEGHINSLFPHTDARAEQTAAVVAVTDSPKPPPRRITLTLPAVNRSAQVWFLVAGEDKADAVAAGVTGGDPVEWPCAGAHGSAATVWFVDRGAAAAL
ncbi:6-phosphogluconolactonase [Williamsia phyllosphaerae]|uniref:6-phosphogluconolactonase n=1 Tax=Williamsia phyllosphaerae TaxID=885042 RepID=A0ABQ1V808_9NOCA|nr:6-phosphogluconolactonase [Williamsia phyllosphaerae]GGF41804.1 6-phosphogluconolactonase [Williamsia phyllosphaerae]